MVVTTMPCLIIALNRPHRLYRPQCICPSPVSVVGPHINAFLSELPDVRAEGRGLNEVSNVTSKASDEGPPCQASEVSFAHRFCSFPRCSSRFQVRSNRAQETGIC